jgi:hypothetical protein
MKLVLGFLGITTSVGKFLRLIKKSVDFEPLFGPERYVK